MISLINSLMKQSLKQKIAWLERNNAELHQELQRAHDGLRFCAQRVLDAMVRFYKFMLLFSSGKCAS
jgi:hypothetical protein